MAATKREYPAIEDVLNMIIEGETFRSIGAKYNLSVSTLHTWLARDEHSVRVLLALHESANAIQEKAIDALIDAAPTMPEIQRARELAQHYRWLAAKRAPKTFSDKFMYDVQSTKKVIKVTVAQNSDNAHTIQGATVKSYITPEQTETPAPKHIENNVEHDQTRTISDTEQ
jgi:hypothetical protein